jgi:hypothetical protein
MALIILQFLAISHSTRPVRLQEFDAANHEQCSHVSHLAQQSSHRQTSLSLLLVKYPGHCFMTEDGGELDNKFEANLGASTKTATRLPKAGETDSSM